MTQTSRINIRLAVDRDADALPRVERSAAGAFRAIPELAWVADDDVLSAEQHRAFIADGWCWVASSDAVVGFLTGERIGGDVHVWELAVEHGSQRQGIGRRLLDAAVQRARAERCARLTLTTFTEVAWNEPFYAACGFVRIPPAGLDERLRRTVELEVLAGMPADRRCAMELGLR